MPTPTPKNLTIFFVILAPPILAMAILLAAAMSGQAAVGLIYIFGLLVLYFAIWPIASSFLDIGYPVGHRAAVCSMFNMHPFINNAYSAPAYYIMIYCYTLFYMCWDNWVDTHGNSGGIKMFFINMSIT